MKEFDKWSIHVVAVVMMTSILSLFIDQSIFFYVLFGNIALILCILKFISKNKIYSKKSVKVIVYYIFILCVISLFNYTDSLNLLDSKSIYIPGGDGELYFNLAQEMIKDGSLTNLEHYRLNYLGYPLLLSFLFKYLGNSLYIAFYINYSLIVFSIVLISMASVKLTGEKKLFYYCILIGALTTPFISIGTIILKDSLIVFSFSLLLYSFVSLRNNNNFILYIILIAVSICMIGVMRLPLLILFPLIYLILFNELNTANILKVSVTTIAIIILLPLLSLFTIHDIDFEFIFQNVLSNSLIDRELDNEGVVSSLIGGYIAQPLWFRVLSIPIPFAIQLVTPFNFWSISFLNDHFWYFTTHQLNFIWYGFTGVLIFVSMFNIGFISNTYIKRLFIFGLFFYSLIAFIYGGAIPRYAIPSIVFMIPCFGDILLVSKRNKCLQGRMLSIYASYYVIGILLFIIYIIV